MIMLLIVHIIFAVICLPMMIGATILKYINSLDKAQFLAKYSTYSLIGLLITGTILVISFKANLVGTCYAGLTYSAFFAVSFLTYKKLSHSKITTN